MEEPPKRAYRLLLFHMLQVFTWPISRLKVGRLQRYNPLFWCRHLPHLFQRAQVAALLRTLALASADDFAAFDQAGFWREFAELERQHPRAGLAYFRQLFEELASGQAKVEDEAL